MRGCRTGVSLIRRCCSGRVVSAQNSVVSGVATLHADDVNELVRDGYDRIAERYTAGRAEFVSLPYLERFSALMTPGGRVLDLGCGSGIPASRFLIEQGFRVVGIDISPRMVELARKSVPEATFEVRDMLSLQPSEIRVEGIVALYSIFHVDREKHQALLRLLRSCLGEDGVVLLTMGASEWEGSEPDFHGASMFWSHFGPERNLSMLNAAGFTVDLDEIDTSGGERHQVLLGRVA